ncbi:unnamed protein product [Discula destructiva]
MTSSTPTSGPGSEAARPSHRDWIPAIPRPLQRLFDSVPLVTYPPNELPYRSPAPSDLPALHVFITQEGADWGLPSYNPSCLKWQTFLRIAGISHNLVPSTNHASPTGALPFLQPALTTDRLDARQLLPIPSPRLETYAHRYGSLPAAPTFSNNSETTPDQLHHRQRAYQALLDHPIRNAWLFALYLSPANEQLLRALYIDSVSRARPVQTALLHQLRTAARAEIAKASDANTTTTTTTGWSLGGNVGDLLTWALAGRTVLDPQKIYAEARRAFTALETLLMTGTSGADNDDDAPSAWFFGASHPTLFDAHVFSYTHLILDDDYVCPLPPRRRRQWTAEDTGLGKEASLWKDDTLRTILRDTCSGLVAHAKRMFDVYWPVEDEVDEKTSV